MTTLTSSRSEFSIANEVQYNRNSPLRWLFSHIWRYPFLRIAFFEQGNTLLTGALPECIDQTVWQSSFWLLPERESPVELVFAREKLLQCPADVEARLREATRVAPRESR